MAVRENGWRIGGRRWNASGEYKSSYRIGASTRNG